MHVCEKCGHENMEPEMESEKEFSAEDGANDSDGSLKDSVLAELMETLEGSLASKFKKKPEAVSVDILSVGPKKDDDEEF